MPASRSPDGSSPDTHPDAGTLSLRLLGGFEVWLGSRQVPENAFPRRKAISLLKLLALQPGYQLHREQILDLLWPDLVPRSASAQLYKAVHHVRQAFETVAPPCPVDELIQIGGDLVGLSAPGGIQTDVAVFEERARQALQTRDLELLREAAAYTGELLPADLYEPWSAERRQALNEQIVDILIELGEGLLAVGRLGEAIDALRQALDHDRSREAAHRTLMLALARQGRRGRALRQYRICVDTLASELDVGVSPETSKLFEAIRDGEVSALSPGTIKTNRSSDISGTLIGRRAEKREVTGILDRLAGGDGSVLTIEGNPGIGKTRFGQEILQLGRARRWHTLFGGAQEQEGRMAYFPFVEALRGALWDNPEDAELIPAELAAAIPEIPATATTVGVADQVASQSALFAGVVRFLTARARTAPVLLILDDLQAVDEGSLKLFHFLARQTEQLPLLLVGIFHGHDPNTGPALAEAISDLDRRLSLRRLSLSPLPEDDHRALIEQTLDGDRVDPSLASELFRLSEGNALFTREITTQLRAGDEIVRAGGVWRLAGEAERFGHPTAQVIPRTLQARTERRLEQLSPQATRLIQLASVAGREVPFSIIEADSESRQSGPAFLDAVDEMLATGLLDETGSGYRFVHPLLRDAVYTRMSRSRQRAIHREVAVALEDLHQHDPAALPVDSLAHHYRNAGEVELAARYLIEAGNRAAAVYDHDGALARFRDVLGLLDGRHSPERQRLGVEARERIGDTYQAIGDVARSLEAYLQVLDERGADPRDSWSPFDLHRKIALAAILAVDLETAGQHLALARSKLGSDALDEARLLIGEALFDWHTLQFEAAVEHGSLALDIAERAGARAEASQACEMLALAHLALGNWEEGVGYERRRESEGWSPEIAVAIDAHLCLYQYRFHTDESYRQVRQFIESVARQSEQLGNLRCLAVCRFVLGYLAHLQGKPGEAMASLSEALDLNRRIGSPAGIAYTLSRQTELLTAARDYDTGWQLVQQGLAIADQAAVRDHCLTQVYTAGIRNRLDADDTASATMFAEAAKAHDETAGPCSVCRPDLYETLAAYHLARGEPDVARNYIEQALPIVDFVQNRPGRAGLLRMLAQVHAEEEDNSEAGRCLLEAVGIFREIGNQYDLARTLQTWGELGGDGAQQDPDRLIQEADEILGRYRVYGESGAAG